MSLREVLARRRARLEAAAGEEPGREVPERPEVPVPVSPNGGGAGPGGDSA